MKKNIILIIGITALIVGIYISTSTIGTTIKKYNPINYHPNGNTWYVGGSGPDNFSKIQDAIDNASDWNTIYVYDDSSPYNENIIINKTIDLIGENSETTMIDGMGRDDVVYISANYSYISGFSIRNSEDHDGYSGIEIRSNNNTITGNILLNNYYSIWVDDPGNNTIAGNTFLNNENGLYLGCGNNIVCNNLFFNDGIVVSSSGNSIYDNKVNYKPLIYLEGQNHKIVDYEAGQIMLLNCNNVTVLDQQITKTITGVQLSYCEYCVVHNNDISHCKAGIHLAGCSNNTISNNSLSSNRFYGIRMYSCRYNLIQRNLCIDNRYGGYWCHGISLFCSSNNTLFHNIIRKNGVGVGCTYSVDNDIICNYISYNDYDGIDFDYSSEDNVVYGNKISGNRRGVTLNDISFAMIKNNTFNDNDDDLYLDTVQYYKFSLRRLPYIDGNYWDRERYLPKLILGTFTFVYMDVPFGGFFQLRWFYIDWHPAKEPYDIP